MNFEMRCVCALFMFIIVKKCVRRHNQIFVFFFPFQVQGMLSQMDPALVSFCDKIAADGGPVQVADDIGISSLTAGPVVQLTAVTRSSARLRHVQPEVNLQQSYEALKRPKKITETEQAGILTSHIYFLRSLMV